MTTDFVLDETLTILKRRSARITGIHKIVSNVLSSSVVRVIYIDESLFRQSLSNFVKYDELSFTDATTLTVMSRYKIKEIYSHDRDFELKEIVRKERL